MPVLTYSVHADLLNWFKGSDMPTAPTSLKVGLLTSAPNPDGTGVAEPNGGHGYVRQTLTLGSITTGTGVSTAKNSAPVVFGPASTSTWATVTYIGIFDGDTDDLLSYGPLAAQRTAPVGDTISFGANVIQLRLK